MNAPSPQWLAELGKSSNSKVALESIVQLFIANTGTLHRMGPDGFLHLVAMVGNFPPPVMDAIRTIPVGKGLAGLAAERRGPVTVCNLQTDTSGDVRPGARATGMEGAITVPCFGGANGGKIIGVLGVATFAPREYSPEETVALLECGRAVAELLGASAQLDHSA
jgi:L-methionine (R)-S-oxide reductase